MTADFNHLRSQYWGMTHDANHGIFDSREMARLLRSNSSFLKEMSVQCLRPSQDYRPTKFPPQETQDWKFLRGCVRSRHVDAAMTVFQAMVSLLDDRPMGECFSLMRDVLQQPWRLQAIATAPTFFLKTLTGDHLEACPTDWFPANALQALASLSTRANLSREETVNAIRALRHLGVSDFPHPRDERQCLHVAAEHCPAPSLQAFIGEFPHQVHAVTQYKATPLHCAAGGSTAENVKLLLNAGATPCQANASGATAMLLAAMSRRLDTVLALIDTGTCTEDDVNTAALKFDTVEQRERVRAMHAAVKVRQAMDRMDYHGLKFNPL